MAILPLEDLAGDVVAKAARGLGLDSTELAKRSGLLPIAVEGLFESQGDDAAWLAVAGPLHLHGSSLLALARGKAQPEPIELGGLVTFTTDAGDMTVNAYVLHDGEKAAIFDTGMDAAPMLDWIKEQGLTVEGIFITHTHDDHVHELARLVAATKAPAHTGEKEPVQGAKAFAPGASFTVGRLQIGTRLTWGHARGGITYVVQGLAQPVAVVGDAVFARSMGGGMVSYEAALRTNRQEILTLLDETVICPGHGPLTTVGDEKQHNPFLAVSTTGPLAQVATTFGKHSRVGFVGVGRMGSNMARRLADCGYTIAAVLDLDEGAKQSVADELKTTAAATPAEVTAACDIIFTVITHDAAMRAIYFGDDNLLHEAKGKLFINCATLSPQVQQEVYAATKAAGAGCVEACMASSISHAREGKLYLMLGGDDTDIVAADEVLSHMCESKMHIGAAGKAAEVKALVNMVMNMNTAALAEGLGLAEALGHNLDLVRKVFAQTGANSRVLETDASDMQAREHDCWFSAEHAAKDSGIALDLAAQKGLSLPVAAATKAQYDKMIELGLGGLDKSGIAELTFRGRHAGEAC